jgi:hypothetical protein
MPAPLDIDREAVKTHAIAHGLADAARAFGIEYATVRQWAKRGQWLVNAGAVTVLQPLPASMRPRAVTGVTVTPSQAMKRSLEQLGSESKLFAAKYARRTLKYAASVAKAEPERALADAQNVKAVVGVAQGANVPGFEKQSEQSAGTVVNIALLGLPPEPSEHAFDIHAETLDDISPASPQN